MSFLIIEILKKQNSNLQEVEMYEGFYFFLRKKTIDLDSFSKDFSIYLIRLTDNVLKQDKFHHHQWKS